MTRRRRRPEVARKPDMTPMIDVTFLLLVFFIVTLNIRQLEGRLDAALPKDRGVNPDPSEQIEKVEVEVYVAEPGTLMADAPDSSLVHYQGRRLRYEIGAQAFSTLDQMEAFLGSFERSTPITLDFHRGATQEDAIGLLDRVIALDFAEIAFAGTAENGG